MIPYNPDDPNLAEVDRRAQPLVEDFVRRQRAGEQPNPFDLIVENPGIAAELERLLAPAIQNHLDSQCEQFCRPANTPLPATIGRYRIEELLGSGASAVVYRAYDPKFERFVALKVFSADPLDKSGSTGRFERDARTLARMRHAHIVQLHETGESDGLRYIDMELVAGQSLQARLETPPPLSFREAARLIWQVADALDHAHRAGVVHRDVKPSNILLQEVVSGQWSAGKNVSH